MFQNNIMCGFKMFSIWGTDICQLHLFQNTLYFNEICGSVLAHNYKRLHITIIEWTIWWAHDLFCCTWLSFRSSVVLKIYRIISIVCQRPSSIIIGSQIRSPGLFSDNIKEFLSSSLFISIKCGIKGEEMLQNIFSFARKKL